MRIAFVGCGYVADLYAATLPNHPQLDWVGCFDRDAERLTRFTEHHGVPAYPSLDDVLDDACVDVVVNLTNPASHAEVTRAALDAGKHVYVEKPLALDLAGAHELVRHAADRGLRLASAPCGLLGEAAQTVWYALRRGEIGTPRLALAQLEDVPILRMPHREWVGASGAPWPYLDEFRTGCTLEHAAYYLTWLTAFFGPTQHLVAYAAPVMPNPYLDTPIPDFSVACLRFASGVVARLTNSIVGPKDNSLRIVGDEGVLTVADCWDYGSPVSITREPDGAPEPYPLVRPADFAYRYVGIHQMDFARGIAAMGTDPCPLPADHALHVLDVTLQIAGAGDGLIACPTTTFAPVPPASWAGGDCADGVAIGRSMCEDTEASPVGRTRSPQPPALTHGGER